MQSAWERIGDMFAVDDGLRPELEVWDMTHDEVVAAWDWLRARSKLATPFAKFWHLEAERDELVRAHVDVARLVVEGRAAAFRVDLEAVAVGDATIPSIGVTVSADGLVIDWDNGPHWDAPAVAAFVDLIAALLAMTAAARFSLEEWWGAEPQRRFVEALDDRGRAS